MRYRRGEGSGEWREGLFDDRGTGTMVALQGRATLFHVAIIRDYRDLVVWQRAMQLAEASHGLAGTFPRTGTAGLGDQLRRAAMSIPANIAEGHGRRHRAEYLRYLGVARGSLMEVQTHLELARRLDFADPTRIQAALSLCDEISRMLTVLRRRLGG
jgi:four helix bundle protein